VGGGGDISAQHCPFFALLRKQSPRVDFLLPGSLLLHDLRDAALLQKALFLLCPQNLLLLPQNLQNLVSLGFLALKYPVLPAE